MKIVPDLNDDSIIFIEFDLQWENSWRGVDLGEGTSNWDAAWVFVKYSADDGGTWHHASLNNSGNSSGNGTSANVQIGLLDENSAFDPEDNPGMGAFFYRSSSGSGTFSISNAQLKWNFGADGLSVDDTVDIKVFAIEMVYVPEGSFYAGDGATDINVRGRFHRADDPSIPFHVNSESAITLGGTSSSNLGNNDAQDMNPEDDFNNSTTRTLPADFPKGYAGFYIMKYVITQQQYVDFLNSLTSVQASSRAYTDGGSRNAISVSDGVYSTDNPYVGNNLMNWMDGAAYADWSGLRPMTELEYEKAARGPVEPVPNERAWGTSEFLGTNDESDGFHLINAGSANERLDFEGTVLPGQGGMVWRGTSRTGYSVNPFNGPIRVGALATQSSNRMTSGASFWGVMELSGNQWERPVSVGRSSGRGYTGRHGDGNLSSNGNATIIDWPGYNNGEVTGADGTGRRGAGWWNHSNSSEVSIRNRATFSFTHRDMHDGYRYVRSLPASPVE